MGSHFDSAKYDRVIEACGLRRDLQLFPDGDSTFVGEKGYTLSGGQKARVTLARAVYCDADVYLLDDPLSAVDPHVANHIFDKCIKTYLKHKTVILVTHQLQFLKQADKVVFLDQGQNLATGTFDELMSEKIEFLKFLEISQKELEKEMVRKQSSLREFDAEEVKQVKVQMDLELNVINKDRDEVVSAGGVKPYVYWNYFRSGASLWYLGVAMIITLVSQVLFHYTDLWLAWWTQDYDKMVTYQDNTINETITEPLFEYRDETHNIIMYCVLTAILFMTTFARTTSQFFLCLRCSINLHNRIFMKMLRAPILFFENNPLGEYN